MRLACRFALLAVAVPIGAGASSQGATMDFESIPIHTVFGGAANDEIGDTVLDQHGITMSVEEFFTGDFHAFHRAEIGRGQEFFPTIPLGLDNISVRFSFNDVGFEVSRASVEFVEVGGATNFSVNDSPVQRYSALTDLPSSIAPSVQAVVEDGVITLLGPVDSFLIGGAELVIDNIIAIPEPGSVVFLAVGAAVVAGLRRTRSRRTPSP